MLILSGVLHALFTGALIIANHAGSPPEYYTGHRIYNVNLVTLPVQKPTNKRSRVRPDEPYRVVSRQEAARPDRDAKLAMERTQKLVSEEPETGPAAQPSFETGTSGINLDVKAFEFPYYLAAIQRKIQQNLNTPRLPGVRKLHTIIYFKIRRNGRIHDMEMEQDSSNPVFDLSARRALERSDPLPPLPDEFEHEYLGVHFEFDYIR